MGKRGPKPWKPTDEQLKKIRLYAGLGATQEDVSRLVGVSVDTLCRNDVAKAAFEEGKTETKAKVAGALVKKALNGDTASAIFYLKTQAGWKETSVQEHTGKDGGPIQTEQVESDADAFRRRLLSGAPAGTAGSGAQETQH
tara:strand:+ start:1572 stop:1994 length:423 start_codon:yes stop_codon:yes gene_type:complete